MCTFTRTAFKMCGHTEYRGARCSPPIIHRNNRHELCKKTPIYLQSTKNGICTQCRTKNWEASMAKSSKVDAEEQHGNKGTRSGLAVGSKNEVSHPTRLPRTNNEELGTKQIPDRAAGDSSSTARLPGELVDFRCELGLSHPGIPCQQAKDRNDKFPHHVSTPTTVNEKSYANQEKQDKTTTSNGSQLTGGGRTLLQLTGSADLALSKRDRMCPAPSHVKDKIKAITGVEGRKPERRVALPGLHPTINGNWNLITVTKPVCRDDQERVALHGPRALPGPHPIPRENWNLIAVTKPVRRDDEERVGLYGPRDLPTTHRTIREDWNLMTVTNPVRRGNGGRLHLRGPKPIPSPSPPPSPIPRPNPAANSFRACQRKAFDFEPLIRQEVSHPAEPTAQEAEQRTCPDQIPLLPISYKPILTGRHPLHRPLPPIPDETFPEQDADCQPPPVPPHVVLYRRKAIAMYAHDNFDSPIERCTSAPEAPAGTYFGRETLYSGWQPARCDTVCSSFSDRYRHSD